MHSSGGGSFNAIVAGSQNDICSRRCRFAHSASAPSSTDSQQIDGRDGASTRQASLLAAWRGRILGAESACGYALWWFALVLPSRQVVSQLQSRLRKGWVGVDKSVLNANDNAFAAATTRVCAPSWHLWGWKTPGWLRARPRWDYIAEAASAYSWRRVVRSCAEKRRRNWREKRFESPVGCWVGILTPLRILKAAKEEKERRSIAARQAYWASRSRALSPSTWAGVSQWTQLRRAW